MLPLDLRDTSAVCVFFIHIDSWVLIRNGINYIYIYIYIESVQYQRIHPYFILRIQTGYISTPATLPQTTPDYYGELLSNIIVIVSYIHPYQQFIPIPDKNSQSNHAMPPRYH